MKILAFAYACEPGRGSEPGAGWAWARMLARLGETWVITRDDYREAIESALTDLPERANLHFVYVELPPNLRTWQRGLRGLRFYYFLWQILAVRQGKRMHAQTPFDVVWHLTWANAWMGSLAPLVGGRFVYGPVGGAVGTIWRLLPHLGLRGALYEVSRAVMQTLGRYGNPIARLSWRRADLILVQNRETQAWLPRRHRAKARIFPNAVAPDEASPARDRKPGPPTAICVGRLMGFKGVFLAIHALTYLPGWHLLIVGDGPERERLYRLAEQLELSDRIRFCGWIDRDEVFRLMRDEADVLLFPCFHEEAGTSVLEAVVSGLPVVALDRGGPPILAGPLGTYVEDSGPADVLASRIADAAREAAGRTEPPARNHDQARIFRLDERARALAQLVSDSIGVSMDHRTPS